MEVKQREHQKGMMVKLISIIKKEVNKSLNHIIDEMEKSADEFYSDKKQKDNDLSL